MSISASHRCSSIGFLASLLLPVLLITGLSIGGPVRAGDDQPPADTTVAVRPTLPAGVEEEVGRLEARVAELQATSRDEQGLVEALALSEEVLAVRTKYQGPGSGWTGLDGEPAEWHAVMDARLDVESLKRRISLSPAERAELWQADDADVEAMALYGQGKFAESTELVESQLEVRERLLGADDPNTLTTLENRNILVLQQRNVVGTEQGFRESVARHQWVYGDDHPATLTSMANLAAHLGMRGRLDEAMALERRIVDGDLRLWGTDHPDTLTAINNLAVTLLEQGKYAESEPLFRESLLLLRRLAGDTHPNTLNAMNNLAALLRFQGRLAEAEPLLRQALASKRLLLGDEHPETLLSINSLAALLDDQGQASEARALYDEGLAGCRTVLGNDHPRTLLSIYNQADLLRSAGSYPEAEALYLEALEGRQRVLGEEHPETYKTMDSLGSLFMDQGEPMKAHPYWTTALAGRQRTLGGDHPATLDSLFNIGTLYAVQGEPANAEETYRKTIDGLRRVLGNEHPATCRTMNATAFLLAANGEFKAAESMWNQSADSFETARLRIGHRGIDRISFTQRRSPLPALAACLARNGKPELAWERLEESLARGLLDTLSASQSRPLTTAERNRETNLIGQLGKLDERISALNFTSEVVDDAQDPSADLRRKKEQLQAELVQFENEMTAKHGVAAGKRLDFARIQAQLPVDTAMLAWVDISANIGPAASVEEHWACVIKSQGPPIWEVLPGSGKDRSWTAEDRNLASELKGMLRHWTDGQPAEYLQDIIRQLHHQRLKPVEEHLIDVSRLIVLPAGEMAGIPLEALTDLYTISYAPSGTMYAWLKENRGSPGAGSAGEATRLLALGDPVFRQPEAAEEPMPDPPDHGVFVAMIAPESNAFHAGLRSGDVILSFGGEVLAGPEDLGPAIQQHAGTEDADNPLADIPVTAWRDGEILELAVAPGKLGVRPAGLPASQVIDTGRRIDSALRSARGTVFDPLPCTRREVETIVDLFQKAQENHEARLLLGSDASEQTMVRLAESGKLKDYRLLHLATHGEMDDKAAMNSALILSQDQLPDSLTQVLNGNEVFDGRLTAEQIVRTWQLDADLVTLSGCETALGRESGGEGFLGFAQALFVAGARSLLLSLWKVDDQATMLLMQRFYANLLGSFDQPRLVAGTSYGPGEPIPKAEALREAKQWLQGLTSGEAQKLLKGSAVAIGERPFRDPQFWAAFILLGDPS